MSNQIKLILFMIGFVIVAVGITAGMIYYQNQASEENRISGDEISSIQSGNQQKEEFLEGIDLKGTYDENSIVFNKVNYEEGIVKGYYQEISGLKNKEVQTKINQKLKNSIFEKLNSKLGTVEAEKIEIYQYVYANFADVISLSGNIVITLKEKTEDGWPIYENEIFYLNLKLTNGEELDFEELFTTDADILAIVTNEIYEDLAWNSKWESMSGTTPEISWEEVVTEIDETELRNRINQFKSQEKKEFYFTPKMILVSLDDSMLSIDMEKYYEDIAIYNRFLEETSLYEDDTIGKKEIVTLAVYYDYGIVYEFAGQKTDNFYCDAKVINWDSPEMSGIVLEEERVTILKNLETQYIEKLNADVQEMKNNIQESGENHVEILIQSYQISNGDLMNVSLQQEIYKMTKEYYTETFQDKMRDAYRSAGEDGGVEANIYISISEDEPIEVERITKNIYHSAKDGRELAEVKDYFQEGYNYESVLKHKLNDFWHQKFSEYLTVEELNEEYSKTRFVNRYGNNFMVLNETLGYNGKDTNYEWSSYNISFDSFDRTKMTI